MSGPELPNEDQNERNCERPMPKRGLEQFKLVNTYLCIETIYRYFI